MKRKTIIDCDPGADDAIALMLALNSLELDIIGITITAGNSTLEKCCKNALKVLELCNIENIPVYMGASGPIKRKLEFSDLYCGKDGLCEIGLMNKRLNVEKQSAVDFIIEASNKYEGLQIISIAPMANIALALQKSPQMKIGQIVTSTGFYNTLGEGFKGKPRCSWNFTVDPEAAKIVFESGNIIKVVGIDVSAELKDEMVYYIIEQSRNNEFVDFLRGATKFYSLSKLSPFSLLVDAMAVAYAVNPKIAELKAGNVVVNCTRTIDLKSFVFSQDASKESFVYPAYKFDFHEYVKMLLERVFI